MSFKPLEGLRVIDITEGVAGPFAAQYLGDLGAEVIKVERPEGDWGRSLGAIKHGFSTQYLALNRNKKNICLNLKSSEGKKIVERLIETSDAIITSFRPGVMEKNGLGYEQAKKLNSKIIYGRISGYGYTGPLSKRTGVDTVTQAISGIMNHIGPSDGLPYRVGFPLIDHVAARDLVSGILAAYINRLKKDEVSGPIDVSLFATAAGLQAQQWQDFLETDIIPRRTGNKNPVIVPSAVYETSDGEYLSVAAVRDQHWERLCEALELDELANQDRFKTNADRLRNRYELESVLEKTFMEKDRKTWMKKLEDYDITFAPVYDMGDIKKDSELMDIIPKVTYKVEGSNEDITSIGIPFVYNNEKEKVADLPPSHRGQHTVEILKDIGYEQEHIESFISKKVIYPVSTQK